MRRRASENTAVTWGFSAASLNLKVTAWSLKAFTIWAFGTVAETRELSKRLETWPVR